MRLPVPGPRDLLSALERGGDQVEALLGAVPRMLALLDQAEVLVARASVVIERVEAVAQALPSRSRGWRRSSSAPRSRSIGSERWWTTRTPRSSGSGRWSMTRV